MRPLPLATAAPDARWECRSCGACCRGILAGVEVTAEEAARIEEVDWTAVAAEEGAPELLVRPVVARLLDEETGAVERRLRTVEGRCVFLDPRANRCRIHARLGWAAKPFACRLFPLSFVEGPGGERMAAATTL